MGKKALVILIGLLLIGAQAFAELEGGTVSSGGKVGDDLIDIKGQSAAGVVTSADGTTTVEVGGIYGIIEFPLPGKGHVAGEVKAYDPAGAGGPIAGAQITVYTSTEVIKFGFSDAEGKYQILNINPTPPPPATTYYIEASANGFFPYRQAIALTADQTTTVNFQLVPGEETGAPAGTVWLMITREGTSVALTWPLGTLAGQVPWPGDGLDIYMLTGNGEGSYQSAYADPPWVKIIDNGVKTAAAPEEIVMAPTKTKLYHNDQVGGGTSEAYYKALLGEVDPTTPDGATKFTSAPAVGKFNLFINKDLGSAPISVPFEIGSNSSLDNVIGPQLTSGGYQSSDKLYTWDLSGNLKEGWLKDEGGGAAKWQGNLQNIEAGTGYWAVITAGHDSKTITVVGRVPSGPVNISLTNQPNFRGIPYPRKTSPATSGLSLILSAGGYNASDKIHSWDSSGSLLENWLSGGGWNGNFTNLLSGKGYWISNQQLQTAGQPDTWIFQPGP